MIRDPSTRRRLAFRLIAVVVTIEVLLIVGALAIRPALRAIPGRYRSRLPEPIQELAAKEHPDIVPTPAAPATFALPTFPVTPPTATPTRSPLTPTPLIQPPTRQGTPSPTPTASPTAEATPTSTPSPTLSPRQIARATPVDLERASVLLTGFEHIPQLWNNCGPATLSMGMNYYGWRGDQTDAAAFLKPDQEDKNVGPAEMVDFIQDQGLSAVLRYGGDVQLIRRLLLAGFPVLVEKGFDPEPDRLGWMGHYLLIIGYNEFDAAFTTMDSYLGPNQIEPYAHFDDYWRHFNRPYVVIYRPEQRSELEAVLGDQMDPAVNLWHTLALAIAEVNEDPTDPFAWFNLGTSYAAVGYYPDAAGSYDQARQLGLPWRMLWYQFGPFEAYAAVGNWDEVLVLAESVIATSVDTVEEGFYYKGVALQVKGDEEGARDAFQQAVDFNPNYLDAVRALSALGDETG